MDDKPTILTFTHKNTMTMLQLQQLQQPRKVDGSAQFFLEKFTNFRFLAMTILKSAHRYYWCIVEGLRAYHF